MNNDTGRTVHEIDLGKVMTVTDASGAVTPLSRVAIAADGAAGQYSLVFYGRRLVVNCGVIDRDKGEVEISRIPLRWSATGN